MWNSKETESQKPKATPSTAPSPAGSPPSPRPADAAAKATIGPSIAIKGDVTGEEDLLIEGKVEGAVELPRHNVTVAASGRVTADIHGKRICIDGQVVGDLFGDEVLIRESGRVQGNAKAPRVTLENGCQFRGSIDMKPKHGEGRVAAGAG